MSDEDGTNRKNFLKALKILKPKYRDAVLDSCNDDEVNRICECILLIFKDKITIQNTSDKTLNFFKFSCFLTSDVSTDS